MVRPSLRRRLGSAPPPPIGSKAFLEGGQHYGKSYLLESLKPELAAKLVIVPLR